MTRYLLDTNMVSHFVNRRLGVDIKVRSTRTRGAVIGTCMPVVAELFYGLELSATCEINRPKLVRGLKQIRCWPFERSAAEEYGRPTAVGHSGDSPRNLIGLGVACNRSIS